MRKLFFCSLILFTSCAGAAIPSMAIPALVYSNSIFTPNATSTNSKSTILKEEQVKKHLPTFNADVRGAIISSGRFKVVKMPNYTLRNTPANLVLNNKVNPIESTTNSNLESLAINVMTTKSVLTESMPEYILVGKIGAITQTEDVSPLKNTDNITNQYNINIVVDYKLIKTSDKSIMASFTAYGHAHDVKILTIGNTNQVQTHNIPLLIQNASKDLAKNVMTELDKQFAVSSENYNNGSKVITDLKIYNN